VTLVLILFSSFILRVGKNPIQDPILFANSFNIHFIKNPIYLKSILLNFNFNLIYILYILWI